MPPEKYQVGVVPSMANTTSELAGGERGAFVAPGKTSVRGAKKIISKRGGDKARGRSWTASFETLTGRKKGGDGRKSAFRNFHKRMRGE